MKRKGICAFAAILLMFLVACSDMVMSLTCAANNGEVFEYSLDLGDNYRLEQAKNGNVIVTRDGVEMLDCQLITSEGLAYMIENAHSLDMLTILVDEENLIGYYYEGDEYPETTYILRPEGAEYGLAISNYTSREDGEDAFSRLTVTKVK